MATTVNELASLDGADAFTMFGLTNDDALGY